MARPRKQIPEQESAVDIYLGSDGYWHAYVPVGVKPDGTADRRHRMSKDRERVVREVRKLQKQVQEQAVPKTGRAQLLRDALATWVEAPHRGRGGKPRWRYNTREGHRWAVYNWLIPGLGDWRLDLLEQNPDVIVSYFNGLGGEVDDGYHGAEDGGARLNQGGVHAVYRTLQTALNDFVKDGLLGRSPIEAMRKEDKPQASKVEITPFFVEEVQRILIVCKERRNGTRWTVGLAWGLRQGEALGLPWFKPLTSTMDKPKGLDIDTGWLWVRQQTERRKWRHGCKDPVVCASQHCRTEPCPPRWEHGCGKPPEECTHHRVDRCPERRQRASCPKHRDLSNCTKLCPQGCQEHAQFCPDRKGGGIHLVDPKSEAGNRHMMLPPQMLAEIVDHEAEQDREKEAAGELYHDLGLVWCQPNGKPIDAHDDWEEWKEILRLADVRDGRVHDTRHTAATMLLLQGVDEKTVMAVMGWSDRRMLDRYQHVINKLRIDAAMKVEALFYGEAPKPKKIKKKEKKEQKVKKKAKQAKLRLVDGVSEGFATDHATRSQGAKIIPFPRAL